ncbi:hypothetical protein C8R48DRAFT_727788 [Suillus tomentosus]|nr:hypothetical protein C8R48DRAFT_727788 [Suillus tomentosus]
MTTNVSSTRNVILYFVALVLPPVAVFFSKYTIISCLLHYYINDDVDANRTRIHCRYFLIIVSQIHQLYHTTRKLCGLVTDSFM